MLNMMFYIIRPNNRLLDQLRFGPADASSILSSSELWRKSDPDGKWTSTEFTAQVKILFILNLKQTYLDYPKRSDFQTFLAELLGSPPFSIDLFDKWWNIERLSIDEDFEEIERALERPTLELVSTTGIGLVDAWLSFLIKKKATKASR